MKFLIQVLTAWTLAWPLAAQEVKEEVRSMPNGQTPLHLFTLTNANGLRARVMTYGATLLAMEAPDRNGKLENLTLYLPNPESYLDPHPLFGSVVGRYANRIDTGGFTIDGTRYELETVNPTTKVHIHGGKNGLQYQHWTAESFRREDSAGVKFSIISPDGQEGFPGNVQASVTYVLTNTDELRMEYEATTDKPTHLNLTNHAYWNLAGAGSGKVLNHQLQIFAQKWLSVDDRKIPTGDLAAVKGSPFDFTAPHAIGERIAQVTGGYDHCFAIDRAKADDLVPAARVADPDSGRVMEVSTTAPGVQLYTANSLSDKIGADGKTYGPLHALCLECQAFPDSPNKPSFPPTLLRPGEVYRQVTVHKFSVAP